MKPRAVQQGTLLAHPEKAPYAGDTYCVNQTARNSQTRRRPGWGPGLLNSAWWEHAQCVGGHKVRGLRVSMKHQKRISKCRCTRATRLSHALLHMSQSWSRMQEVYALRHLATKQCCIVTTNTSAHVVKSMCVWEALDVSGRGTAPAKPALCVGVVDD